MTPFRAVIGICRDTNSKNGAIKEGDNLQYAIDPDRCTECVGWYEAALH